MSLNRNQSQIQGGAREVQAPPLFLDQKEARKKLYLETGTPPNPLSKGLDDRPPPLPPPYLKVWIRNRRLKVTGFLRWRIISLYFLQFLLSAQISWKKFSQIHTIYIIRIFTMIDQRFANKESTNFKPRLLVSLFRMLLCKEYVCAINRK